MHSEGQTMKGSKSLNCKVISDVTYEQKKSSFYVRSNHEDKKKFRVVNRDVQAMKDYLCVRPGQEMNLDGKYVGDVLYDTFGKIILK